MGYRGLIAEIPIASGGLTGNKNMTQVGVDEVVNADNVAFDAGTLMKEGGASKYNSSAITGAPSILAGFDWFPSAGVQRMIVYLSDNTIKKDSGAGTFGTTLVSGLSAVSRAPMFVAAGGETVSADRKLFFFSGSNQVKVLAADGATMSDIATPPADWTTKKPVTGCVHEGRLWGFAGHRGYYSTTGGHEDFTGAGSGNIAIYPGDGEEIVAAISFKGLLLVFKQPNGIYAVDTSNATVANWRVIPVTRGLGIAGPASLVQGDNDILIMDAQGAIHALSAVQEFGDISSSSLTDAATLEPFIRDNFNFGRMGWVQAIYYEAKREVHFAVSLIGSSRNNGRLVIDFNRSDRPRFRASSRDICQSIWLKKDGDSVSRPMVGDNAGFVWNLDQETKSLDGAGYEGTVTTGYYDFSHLDPALSTKRKIAQFLEGVFEPVGDWDLTVDVYWDGVLRNTITFNMGTSGAVLGSFVLGTDKLAGSYVLNKKRRITGGGRRCQLVIRNSGVNQDFSLARLFVHFKIGDEREAA